MKNATLYIDLAFCLILLPLMIYAFPVERWWSVNWVFFCSFIVWLYTSYFTYRFFIVPNLFKGGRLRLYAIGVLVASVLVTLLISSVHITSPIHHIRRSFMEQSPYPIWGVRPSQQAVWLYYIIVVMFSFAVGMLSEVYRQRVSYPMGNLSASTVPILWHGKG